MTVKGTLKSDNEVALFISGRCTGFEYAGNYTGADGRADVRCKQCGTVINRSMISIRKNHFGCPTCNQKKREQRQAELKKKRAERRRTENANESRRFHRSSQIEILFCPVCGEHFEAKPGQIYCSQKCYRKTANYLRGSRDRLNSRNIVDKDITLTKLYQRDKGLCYLCGKPCDWNDQSWNEQGIFLAGDNYPSIDHVVPLARGGKHEWNNVKLAHRICNAKKWAKT